MPSSPDGFLDREARLGEVKKGGVCVFTDEVSLILDPLGGLSVGLGRLRWPQLLFLSGH